MLSRALIRQVSKSSLSNFESRVLYLVVGGRVVETVNTQSHLTIICHGLSSVIRKKFQSANRINFYFVQSFFKTAFVLPSTYSEQVISGFFSGLVLSVKMLLNIISFLLNVGRGNKQISFIRKLQHSAGARKGYFSSLKNKSDQKLLLYNVETCWSTFISIEMFGTFLN